GGGSQERELRALALDLRLKHVRFVGRVEPDAMADVYAEHDIYVQSPTVDNLPNSVIEAFACGLPVVSTDVGGLPRMITHEEHGLLAPTNDHCALAAHVLRLLDEPALAARLTRVARDTCHTYRWST